MTESMRQSRTMWTQIGDLEHTLEYPTINGIRTRVLTLGQGASTIVLLSGTTGHLEAFTHNLREFAEKYRVIAYDYPGHGYSTLVDGTLEIKDYTAHLLGLLDHYQLDQVVLCGESLGGWIAIKAGQQYPERFTSIILSAPGGRMASSEQLRAAQEATRTAVSTLSWESIQTRLEKVIHDPAAVTDELIASRLAIYSQPRFARSVEAILALTDPETRYRNRVEPEDYEKLTVPTLLVWTDHEPSATVETGRQLAAALPDGEFLLIENACHWPQWENPALFNKTTLNFLEKVDAHA